MKFCIQYNLGLKLISSGDDDAWTKYSLKPIPLTKGAIDDGMKRKRVGK